MLTVMFIIFKMRNDESKLEVWVHLRVKIGITNQKNGKQMVRILPEGLLYLGL